MGAFLQFSINGLMSGSLYALIAVGIVSVYKSTKVVNFAHGHIIMFGAYVFYSFAVLLPELGWTPDWYRSWEPQWLMTWGATADLFSLRAAVFDWGKAAPRILIALTAAVFINAMVGVLIERFLMRPLRRTQSGRSSFSMLMVTIGLISVFNGIVTLFWTGLTDFVPHLGPNGPIWIELAGTRIFVMGSSLTNFVLAAIIYAAILLLFFLTRVGIALRATAEDPGAAAAMGIDVPKVFSGTWMLACATGAVAGAILASGGVTPMIGLVGFSVLAVVVMGGLDSFFGCAVAALGFGWVEAMARWKIGDETASILPYAMVLLVILIRPSGLFGSRAVERI